MSEVTPLGSGRFRVTHEDGSTTIAWAVRSSEGTWVFINGDVFQVADAGQPVTRPRSDEPSALAAPMPATVLAVNVAPGAEVEAGEVVLLLEAMKMELPIKAPRAGTVGAVHCRQGELVQPGVPLIELIDRS